MYKLMIVDDEQIEREGMAEFIPWEKYDIELSGTAWNGLDAFEQIQKNQPDIVLTDIKMPIMDGIALIGKITENFPDIRIIVLSGYGEYEYTSKAMEYGVRHYILKPCDEEKIVSVLENVKEEIRKKQDSKEKEQEYHKIKRRMLPRAKEEMFRNILLKRNLPEGEQDLLQQELEGIGDSVILLAMKNSTIGFDYLEQFILGNILYEILKLPEMPLSAAVGDTVFFLLDAGNVEGLEAAVEKTKLEFSRKKTVNIVAAVSRSGDFSTINNLYEQILYLYELAEKRKNDGYLSYEKTEDETTENSDFFFDFSRILHAERYDEVLFEISLALKKMELQKYSQKQKNKMCRIFVLACAQKENKSDMELPQFENITEEQELLTELTSWVAKSLGLYQQDKQSIRMQEILEVIYCNLTNTELNIQYMAKEILFMNEDYFGRLFGKTMQVKFSTYLEEVRIRMAKRLLSYDKDMRIADLTEQVGYPSDGQYFSKIFRKLCGKTPSEYREELKKEDTEKSDLYK